MIVAPEKTTSVQVTFGYRDGVHWHMLHCTGVDGWPTEKPRRRVVRDPLDHEPILRMYERQTGAVVLRDTKENAATNPPYGHWAYRLARA